MLWDSFGAKCDAVQAALDVLAKHSCDSYYVGVAKDPAERYFERASAHRIKYQRMYVLCVHGLLRV